MGPAAVMAIQQKVRPIMIQPGPDEVDPADSQHVHGRDRGPHDQRCPVQNAESTPLVDPFHLPQTS